jgi:hypothetical protein
MRRQLAVFIASSLTLSACGGGSPEPENAPVPPPEDAPTPVYEPPPPVYEPPPPADEPPPPQVFMTSQSTCTSEGEGLALELVATDPLEAPYLDRWDACTGIDSAGYPSTWLRNRTDAVWLMPGIMRHEQQEFTPSSNAAEASRAPTFVAMAEELGGLGSTVFLIPGEAVRIARAPRTSAGNWT